MTSKIDEIDFRIYVIRFEIVKFQIYLQESENWTPQKRS